MIAIIQMDQLFLTKGILAMSNQLPIYRLRAESVDVSRLIDLGKRIFEFDQPYELSERGTSHVLRSGQLMVELDRASGGVWAADEAQLWKPAMQPKLLDDKAAIARANEIIQQRSLLPQLAKPFRFARPRVGGTYFSMRREGKREDRRLDTQIVYPVMVGEVPVIGGGDFTVILGDGGVVIGFSGVWRYPQEAFEAEVVAPERVDEQFRAMTKAMKILSVDRSLAYYAAPFQQKQEFLYPVYVYRGTALIDDHPVTMRQVMLPATDFGPPIEFGEPQPAREKAQRPIRARQRERRRSYATLAAARNPFEAGTSWIGQSGGLPGSQANAQGFVDELAASGWLVNFNWGDANAWESDWRRNDDTWVDAADFVFYTGHADMNGWVLSNPDDHFLSFTEIGGSPQTPGDLWGQNDLEWVVIAACGPLQDEILASGGGDVFARWDGAFDGLHILLGYGAITFDNTEEGKRLVQYARGGSTLIDAWFRAAKEIQPSTNGASAPDGPDVYVGAMWVGRDGIDPFNDHAWGFGSVSADPTSPTWYAAMWTLC
jgi:hypothetical protein